MRKENLRSRCLKNSASESERWLGRYTFGVEPRGIIERDSLRNRALLFTACGIIAVGIGLSGEATGTGTVRAAEITSSVAEDSDAQSQTTVTGYAAYDEILQQYLTAYQAGWDVGDFAESPLCYIAGYLSSADKLGYYLTDLDADGVEELLIGEVSDADFSYPGMFYDLYTIKDGSLTKVAETAERSRYYLCTDGTVGYEGSSSAFCSSKAYYALTGTELDILEAVLFDDAYDSENPYFYSTEAAWDDYSTPITDADAAVVYASYEYMKIVFTPLSEAADTLMQISLTEASELKKQALTEVAAACETALEIENTLASDATLTQGEMNELAYELYETWDTVLNSLWGYLKESLPAEEMAELTTEELAWIDEKEAAVAEAGEEYAGGSLQSYVENETAASITRKRVYVLLNKLS